MPVCDVEHGFAHCVHRARLLLNFAGQVQRCTRDDLQWAEKVREAYVHACGQDVHDKVTQCFKAVLPFWHESCQSSEVRPRNAIQLNMSEPVTVLNLPA